MQNYLTADNLTVGYRGKPILSDISMTEVLFLRAANRAAMSAWMGNCRASL